MNLLDLFVKIGVKDEASAEVGKVSKKLGTGWKTAAKVGIAAISAAATAAAGLMTVAVKNYAEYEQLVGGVETLFKGSAGKVQEYAAQAYETAGLSANAYMETVTSFSASLLQSLGGDTAAAAEKADMAIIDMSDNANKMGTDMTMIQNAYQGFAKQNFMMLDNLKLGYGGTKTEMERLLADATAISGIEYDVSSYADIVDAIHVIQTEMGIAGTTALEASTTIEGSFKAAKSAWQNLMTGMADGNADIDTLIDDFVESVDTAADNVLPVAEKALEGVLALAEKLLPKIAERLPEILTNAVPKIMETGVKIVLALIKGITKDPVALVKTAIDLIKTLATGIIENLPEIIFAGIDLIQALIEGIITNVPNIILAGGDIIAALLQGAVELFGDIFGLGEDTVDEIKAGIAEKWEGLKKWFKDLWNSLFGNLSVDVNVHTSESGETHGGSGGHFATGLDYVPYDEFPAYLHTGEMVLTAAEANAYRKGRTGGVTIIQNITAVPQTPVEFAATTSSYAEQARWVFE